MKGKLFKPKREITEKSCGVILYRLEDGIRQYLLLHYPSGHWDFPKGHVEKEDANEIATALRELDEETGISEVEFDSDYREPMYYEFSRGRKELVKKTVVYFLARTNKTKIKISFEHKGFKWLPYEPGYEQLTFENAKNLLKKAEDHLK